MLRSSVIRVSAILIVAATGWLVLGLTARSDADAAEKPNIVFFLVDDLGWTDLGCYGSRFYETPNIDRLCGQGVKFTDAYAAGSVCSPTRASIITGRYPARTGCTNYGGSVRGDELGLAKPLSDAGYRTLFAGKWHIGRLSPEAAGFDATATIGKGNHDPKGTRALTDAAVKFITANKDRPLLAYISYWAVHTPCRETEPLVEKYREKLRHMPPPKGPITGKERDRTVKLVQNNPHFAAMLEAVDDSVGTVLNTLNDLGIDDRTIVIFFSDNGGLSTRGFPEIPTSNVPLRAGKGWLYEGGIRDPLIVKWPGVTEPGSVCRVPVTSTDFFPTILQMAALPLHEQDHCNGVSLAALLRTGDAPRREALYWHYPHNHGAGSPPSGAIRAGDFKLIEFFGDGSVELYNLAEDLSEKNNLADAMPEKKRQLLGMLKAWQKSMPGIGFGGKQRAIE